MRVLNKRLNERLDGIEESVNLGTLDTTILGLMIFVVATALAALSLGFPKLLIHQPYMLTGAIIFLVFVIPLFYLIYQYALSVFVKDGRFTNKILTITYVFGLMTFVGLIWLFLFIAWIYERWWPTPPWLSTTIMIVFLLASVLLSTFYIRPKIGKYFKDNFPILIGRRLQELEKEKKIG